MTDEEKKMIRLLDQCSFLPGSADKRFVKDMAACLLVIERYGTPMKPLTEKQKANLLRLFHRYRRQHGQCECDLCRECNR